MTSSPTLGQGPSCQESWNESQPSRVPMVQIWMLSSEWFMRYTPLEKISPNSVKNLVVNSTKVTDAGTHGRTERRKLYIYILLSINAGGIINIFNSMTYTNLTRSSFYTAGLFESCLVMGRQAGFMMWLVCCHCPFPSTKKILAISFSKIYLKTPNKGHRHREKLYKYQKSNISSSLSQYIYVHMSTSINNFNT